MTGLRTQVVVTTYKRPAQLAALLAQLAEYPVDVAVFDDDPQTDNRELCCTQHFVAGVNHGRDRYWAWVTHIFQTLLAQPRRVDRYLFLPDDVSLCRDFFDRCETRWRSLPPRAASLNVLVDDRYDKANWTNKLPVRYNEFVDETWWTDGAFYADALFFEALDWTIQPIPSSRWSRRMLYTRGVLPGSGVWSQATHRLVSRGLRLFRSYHSLVLHHDGPSQMNPQNRQLNKLSTVRWIDA